MWTAFGSFGGFASAQQLVALPNGDLIAGGTFSSVAGTAANNIARWDGTSWHPLGSGISGSAGVYAIGALTALPNGDVIAGGDFSTAGGVACNNIARWNGTAWSSLGLGVNGPVTCVTHSNGEVVTAGRFTTAGSVAAPGFASWNGTAWSPGPGPVDDVLTMLPSASGLLIGGHYDPGGASSMQPRLWLLNGTTLTALPISSWSGGYVRSLVQLPGGDVLIGGSFSTAGTMSVRNLVRWTGSAWTAVHPGFDGAITALATGDEGDLLAAGRFTSAPGAAPGRVARRSAGVWTVLTGAIWGDVNAVAKLPNGHVVIGGSFANIDGMTVNNIARWDGTTWHAMGAGIQGVVHALMVMPTGDLIAGGTFLVAGGIAANSVARWNGTSWTSLGSGVTWNSGGVATVRCLAVASDGGVIAGGAFLWAGGLVANNIARWNGTAWSPLGTGTSSDVYSVAVAANGDVFAGGAFTIAGGSPSNNIARWNGASWSALGSGLPSSGWLGVNSLATLPDGEVMAGGHFWLAGSTSPETIARWDGSTWSGPTGGISGTLFSFSTPEVLAMRLLPNGDVAVGGEFLVAGGRGYDRKLWMSA